MKKTVTNLFKLMPLAAAMLLFGNQKAQATHAQGADLTYVNVAPNIYVIKYNLYRDCSGIDAAVTETLTYRAPGCTSGNQTLSMSRTNQTIGNPYCNSVSPGCTTNGLSNFQENTYTGTLTLPSACPNWLLSCRIGNRNSSRTLTNGQGEYLYTEAMINNVATQINNSPAFGKLPVPFVGVDKTIVYNHGVIDLDGDSLVYSLQPGLTDLNTSVAYSSYPAGVSPGGTAYPAGTFSAANPIISQNPITIDMYTGTISFKPLSYVGPGMPSNQGLDKYVVVVQVDEYRKINGVDVKIGHVRRDIMVTVIDCGPNQLPLIPAFIVDGTSLPNNQVLQIAAGQPINITVNAVDDNPANIVTLTSNVADALPGATFTVTGGARPSGTVSWTPTAAQKRTSPYFFNVTATDDACPVKGYQTFTMGLRVANTGTVLGTAKNLPAHSFTAYPNPGTGSEVNFKITNIQAVKNAEVVIYNLAGKVVDRLPVATNATEIQWQKDQQLPAGVYFARLNTEAGTQTIKLVHLK